LLFSFQAEDGIRDKLVTGVQTCALPISWAWCRKARLLMLLARSGWPWGYRSLGYSPSYISRARRNSGSALAYSPWALCRKARLRLEERRVGEGGGGGGGCMSE